MAAHTDLKKFLTKNEKYQCLESGLISYCSVASAFVKMYHIEDYIITDVFTIYISSVVNLLASDARGLGSIPGSGDKISVSVHAPLALFSGMNVAKFTVLRVGTLTGSPHPHAPPPVRGESSPLQVKDPYRNDMITV